MLSFCFPPPIAHAPKTTQDIGKTMSDVEKIMSDVIQTTSDLFFALCNNMETKTLW